MNVKNAKAMRTAPLQTFTGTSRAPISGTITSCWMQAGQIYAITHMIAESARFAAILLRPSSTPCVRIGGTTKLREYKVKPTKAMTRREM
jgi:hypothetical protein